MADTDGNNDYPFLATDLGSLTFDNPTTAQDTHTELSGYDSVGIYSEVTRYGQETLGDDPADNFAFAGSGVGTVTVTFGSLSSGTYASYLMVTPTSGVSKVDGDIVATFYGGTHAYSDTRNASAVDASAEGILEYIQAGLILPASVDTSNTTWSQGGEMTAVWTLNGDPITYEVSGFQLNGNDIPTSSNVIEFGEVYYRYDITPQDRMFSDIGNGGLLFENAVSKTQTHTGADSIDTYVFNGNRSDFRIESETGTSMTVSNERSRSTPDVLIDIERIELNDGYLAFDTDGNAGQIYRLYQAAFDRDPDVAGLGHWIDTFDRGLFDLTGVAQEFLISDEFELRFGTSETLGDKDYLILLYKNVLDREPDEAGFDFWEDQQAQGLSRADMLQHFSESPENFDNVAAEIDAGIFYL